MDKLLLISAASHAGARDVAYRPYLESRWQSEFVIWTARSKGRQVAAPAMAFDVAQRLRDIDQLGVAAEVLFPEPLAAIEPPFGPLESPSAWTPAQQLAGAQAYNRWLADFCTAGNGRLAGLAIIVPHDVAAAVTEVNWARRAGLRGVLLPTITDLDPRPAPVYSDAVYDPFWATCQELDMPVHVHPWKSANLHGQEQGSELLDLFEQQHVDRRLLAFLIQRGVFERFSRLRFVLAALGSRWLSYTLEDIDTRTLAIQQRGVGEKLSLKPSEYFTRNVWVTLPGMTREECDTRLALGVHKLMWGSGYPEPTGTWPETPARIQSACVGLSPRETNALLGENAARVYGFELGQLRPIAERIGPAISDIGRTVAMR